MRQHSAEKIAHVLMECGQIKILVTHGLVSQVAEMQADLKSM